MRVTCTTITARRDSGTSGCSKPACASSGSKRGSEAWTISPRPCSRRIRGGPWKAHSITTTRPFSRMCAIVSAPLPTTSR